MKRGQNSLAGNAMANLVRGCASAVVAIALPKFLVHSLDVNRFSAWALVLQIAAYANFFDFGLQTAVARFLAYSLEAQDERRWQKLISTSLGLLLGAAVLVAIIIAGIAFWLPNLFSQIPISLVREARIAVLIAGGGAALALPFSVYTGVLVGLQRNELPAIATGTSRLLGALLVIVASRFTHSLPLLALGIAVPNVLSGVAQWGLAERLLPGAGTLRHRPDRAVAAELAKFCFGLIIIAVGMLLISGLDTTIVAHFAFKQVGAYSLGASLVAFTAGVSNSLVTALLAPLAALHAKANFQRMQEIVLGATRFTLALNLLALALAVLHGQALIMHWVGAGYVAVAYPILVILVAASAIRLMSAPYSTMLIALGRQNYTIGGSTTEAIINLICSCIGAAYIGGRGVALGTLIGSLCTVPYVLYVLRKEREVCVRAPQYLGGIARVAACFAPLLLVGVAESLMRGLTPMFRNVLEAVGWTATILCLWAVGQVIPRGIRDKVERLFHPLSVNTTAARLKKT